MNQLRNPSNDEAIGKTSDVLTRLPQSHDGHRYIRRTTHLQDVSRSERTARFVFSTEALDRHETIIRQSWRLSNYRKNPVVLWCHDSKALAIGRAPDVDVINGRLIGTVHFASANANPFAEYVFQSYLESTLNAGSVGFHPHSVTVEKVDGEERIVLSDNELLEYSLCPVPSNPEVLAEVERDWLRTRISKIFVPSSMASATRGGNPAADSTPNGVTGEPMDINATAVTPSAAQAPPVEATAAPESPVVEDEVKVAEEVVVPDVAPAAPDAAPVAPAPVAVEAAPVAFAPAEEGRSLELRAMAAQLSDLQERLEKANAARAAAESKLASYERDAQEKRIAAEVDALVGVKIKPEERDLFVELRSENPNLFTKLVGQRSDLGLTNPNLISTEIEAQPMSGGADGGELAALMQRNASRTGGA